LRNQGDLFAKILFLSDLAVSISNLGNPEENRTSRPASISELSDLTGRKQGNLSRTLKTMSHYGLVRMEKSNRSVRPIAQAQGYQIMA
jgi:predicted transcriptional regulator